jgi:hypothetical protein
MSMDKRWVEMYARLEALETAVNELTAAIGPRYKEPSASSAPKKAEKKEPVAKATVKK